MVVMAVTFVLFVVAVLVRGLAHDLLLEAGVFLVSVKLMLMSSKNAVVAIELLRRLERIQAVLDRLDQTTRRQPPA